jgi:hypothetical protein
MRIAICFTDGQQTDIVDQYGGDFTLISAADSINRKHRIVLKYILLEHTRSFSNKKYFQVEKTLDRFTGYRKKSQKFQQIWKRNGDKRNENTVWIG